MALAILYQHINFGGSSTVIFNNNPTVRYAIGTFNNEFRNFNDKASSAMVFPVAGHPIRNTLCLFQHDHFYGMCQAYSYQQARNIPWIGDAIIRQQSVIVTVYGIFNDQTSSAVIIKHPDPPDSFLIAISFKGLEIQQNIRQLIEKELVSQIQKPLKSITLRKDPLRYQFTIDKAGLFSFPLVRWQIPLHLDFNGFPDDNIEVYMWLYFYIDSGAIKVSVVDSYVGGLNRLYTNPFLQSLVPVYGLIAGIIAQKLRKAIDGFGKTVEAKINELLRVYSVLSPKQVYLMPGTAGSQPIEFNFTPRDYFTSDTNFDTTLVLQL